MDDLRPFKENLKKRYDKDIMVSGPLAALIILIPALYHYIITTFFFGRYYEIASEINMFEWMTYVMSGCTVVAVIYPLYTRLVSHAGRDREWRESLISFAEAKGASTEALYEKHQEICEGDRFRMLKPLRVFAGITAISTYIIVIFGGVHWFQQIFCIFAGPVGALAVTLPTLVLYPSRHESGQIEFTRLLKEALGEVGIEISAMPETINHKSLKETVRLSFMSVGLYLVYDLMRRIFTDMNHHMRYQHAYERVLSAQLEGRDVRLDTDRKGRFIRLRRKPRPLIIAELFLVVVCLTYLMRLSGISLDIYYGISHFTIIDNPVLERLYNYVMAFVEICLMMVTIQALVGIKSGRIKSWRKVTRSCLAFMLMVIPQLLIYRSNSYTHIFDFNPYMTTVSVYGIILLMILSISIRKYYTPVGIRMPKTPSWVRYVFYGKLFPDENDDDRGLLGVMKKII